ncbi:MAG: DUF5690 family protein [Planctomycetota bacterium]
MARIPPVCHNAAVKDPRGSTSTALITAVASFATYFCMYAFRKPFAVATFDGLSIGETEYKIALLISQVAGYTLSKFLGIRAVSGLHASKRISWLIALVVSAEIALLLFGVVPAPYNFLCLFLNGLPLGMVWGIVFSFVEGRRYTEMIGAGLCASFVVSSGAVKSVGSWLMDSHGVSEFWMPAATGALFLPPFLVSVYALSRVPAAETGDVDSRSARPPMTSEERRELVRQFGFGIFFLVVTYAVLNTYRDLRDNFAAELWSALGHAKKPELFTLSELPIAILVLIISSALVLERDNRRAFWYSVASVFVGAGVVLTSTLAFRADALSGALWMVAVGFGLYLPYIAFHVAVYERFLAIVHTAGNVGFLMYLSDSLGYTGSVGVMLYKNFAQPDLTWLEFFVATSYAIASLTTILGLFAVLYFRARLPRSTA